MGYFKQFAQGFYYILRSFKMIGKKKLFIIFLGLLIFVLSFSFNQKVFAVDSESVQVSTASNMSISNDGLIITGSTNLGYFEIEPNYEYTVELVSSSARLFGFGSSAPSLGQQLYNVTTLLGGSTFTFSRATQKYIYFDISNFNSSSIKVTRVYKSDFDYVSQDLATTLSLQNLWSDISPVVVIISIGVLLALGFVVFKKATKGTSKHQAKM